jgi:hypothetical protein
MNIVEKLENYLIELGILFEKKGANLWIVSDEAKGLQSLIISLDGPVVALRVTLMSIPDKDRERFFKTLLELNATDLIHGAYGIDGNNVIWIDTLEGETLDLQELQASVDAISLALSQHYKMLSEYRNK